MSEAETTPAPAPSRRRAKKQAKKSLWQMDMSSIGKKETQEELEARLERPPFEPTLPQVNLLPADVRDSIAIGKVRKWTIAALVVLAAVVAGVWWLQAGTISRAESDLATATAQNAKLRADLDALAPVKEMYEQITRLQDVVTTTMASQPQASVVIDRLATAAAAAGGGSPIELTSVDVTYTGIPTPGDPLNSCPNPDPFGTDITVGCLTFGANAANRDQVANLLRALAADPLFVGPYVTSSQAVDVTAGAQGKRTESQVAFSGSAGVSLAALKTLLTPEQVQEILTPPKPTPSASASPAGGSS